MKSISLKGFITSAAGPSIPLGPMRIRIVYDKQTNAAAPLATDILVNDNILGLPNLANAGRFICLMDKIFYPTEVGSSGAGAAISAAGTCIINETIKCDLPVKYNANNLGTVADIVSGGLFAVTYSNGYQTIGDDTITYRVRFTDE